VNMVSNPSVKEATAINGKLPMKVTELSS